MIRFCECGKEGCLPCAIRTGPATERNQRIWNAWGIRKNEITITIPKPPGIVQRTTYNGKPKREIQVTKHHCVHLGKIIEQKRGCGNLPIYACDLHGQCTVLSCKNSPRACVHCEDYAQRNGKIQFVTPLIPEISDDPYWALKTLLPPGIPTDEQIQRGLHCVSRTRTQMPPHMKGRGIVYVAGGWRFMCGVFVSAKMVRWLGCDYPIEIWYNGDMPGEFEPVYEYLMRDLGVTFHDTSQELKRLGITRRTALNGWPMKPLAYLLSSFAEVLGLDADCYPVLNPSMVFDHYDYHDRGSILWPDIGTHKNGAPLESGQWERFGLEPRNTPGIESGQVVIDKRRHWQALSVCAWLNDHHDYCYQPGPAGLYGDKDTFAIAFHATDEWGGRKTGVPYAQAPPARWVHVAFMQHDLQGRTMFVHRCGDKPKIEKWSYGTKQQGKGKMVRCDHAGKRSPALAHEWKVFDLVEEYRRELLGKSSLEQQIVRMKSYINTLSWCDEPLSGRGIVTLTSPGYWPGTWVLLNMLRHVGCSLPVQVWYRQNEGLPDCLATFPGVDPRIIYEKEYRQYQHTDAFLSCGWRHIFYIDSDAYPVIDPTPCFDDLAGEYGIGWEDHADSDVFYPHLYGLTERDRRETFAPMGGAKLIDMQKSWMTVSLANWLCHNEEFYFPGQLGEQAQFRAAWGLIGEMPKRYTPDRCLSPYPTLLIHQWRDGKTPFIIHRVSCKFAPAGTFPKPPMRYPELPMEDVAWQFYESCPILKT